MLRTMRKNMKSLSVVLWVVVAAFIGTIFLVWGRGRLRGNRDILAHVGDRVITYPDFRRAYAKAYDFYRRMFKEHFSEDLIRSLHLKEQVLNNLINDRLIEVVAEKEGITVYPREVVEEISKMEAFKTNGRFDPEKYRRVLQLNRLTPAEFEGDVRGSILKEKVLALVKDSAIVPSAEVRDEIIYGMEGIKLRYAELSPKLFMDKVEVKGELQPYYQEHMEDFRVPEMVRVAYIPFLIEAFKSRVKVNEGEMKRYYQENAEDFPAPLRLHLLVITVKDRKRLKGVEKELASGEFSKVARRYSQDPLAPKGGDMGWVELTALPPQVSRVVSSLGEGEISKPVKVGGVFKIFKLVERKEGGVKPFEDVKGEIRERIVADKARKEALRSAAMARQMLRNGATLKEVAAKLGLSVVTSPFFSKQGHLSKLPPELRKVAFEVAEGSLSDIVRTKEGFYILKVLEKRPSYIPPLKEVKAQVEEEVRLQKAKELLYRKANWIVSQAQSRGLKEVLKGIGLCHVEVKTSNLLTRASPGTWERSAIEKAFDLDRGAYAWEKRGDGVVIFTVAERREVSEASIEKMRPRLERYLLMRRRRELEDQWLKDLRGRIEVKVNERLWNAI